MIKLTQLMKESSEEQRPLSLEVKKHFLEIVSTYNKYQESLDRKSDIVEICETLGGITEAARTLAIHEGDDWFDKHTVKRNMSELDKLGKQFDKVAIEAKGLDQRMAGLYEDMGHILSRYYKMGEITEDQMKDRLGMNESRIIGKKAVRFFIDVYNNPTRSFAKTTNWGTDSIANGSKEIFDLAKKKIKKDKKSGNYKIITGTTPSKLTIESVKESKSNCGCGCNGVTKGGCNDK